MHWPKFLRELTGFLYGSFFVVEKLPVVALCPSVVENSYSGVLRSVLRSGESAFFYSGEGDRSGELKGPGECLRSTPGISRHNIVFSSKNTVF